MNVTVVNNLGIDFPEQISSLPGITEIRIDPSAEVPHDLHGDVIFTHTRGAPNLGVRRRLLPVPHAGMEITTDLSEVISDAHHLVLAAPATSETIALVDHDMLARVTPGLHIVNIARGTLIDQEALREALDDGRVARASLDAVVPEPLPDGHWLYTHPNVRLSPHISGAAPKSGHSMFDTFIANFHRFTADEPLEGIVDHDLGY